MISWLRLQFGLKDFIKAPVKFLPLLLLCGAFLILWGNRDKLLFFTARSPILITAYNYALCLLMPLVFLVLLGGLLLLLTKPRKAGAFEDCLRQEGLVDRYGNPPALISSTRISNTDARILAFYSPGIGWERWAKQSVDTEDALNVHFVEPVKYGGKRGNNRNIIVLTVAPGAGGISRKETVYDDEL